MQASSSGIGLRSSKRTSGFRGLSSEFDGLTIAQLSDIHLDEFTEPFLLREAIDAINQAEA